LKRLDRTSETQKKHLELLGIPRWILRENQHVVSIKGLSNKSTILDDLAFTVSQCTRCSLHTVRKNTVFGSGSRLADWLFVGEAPGAEEDRTALPFVGRAGMLLDSMIKAVGIRREDVYVTNVLKCRPPDNRDPAGVEVKQCSAYLEKQIKLVEPRIIIALGRCAAQALLQSSIPIGKLRGQLHSHPIFGIPLITTYHPAYLLRSPLEKRKVWDDLLLAKTVFNEM